MKKIKLLLNYIFLAASSLACVSCTHEDVKTNTVGQQFKDGDFSCKNIATLEVSGDNGASFKTSNKKEICEILTYLDKKWNEAVLYDSEYVHRRFKISEAKRKKAGIALTVTTGPYYGDFPSIETYDKQGEAIISYSILPVGGPRGLLMSRTYMGKDSAEEKLLFEVDVRKLVQIFKRVCVRQGVKPNFFSMTKYGF